MSKWLYISASLLVVVFSVWLLIHQTEGKTRIIVAVILASGIAGTYKEIHTFLATYPKPVLILHDIKQHSDRSSPTAAIFIIQIKNTGNAEARNVHTKHLLYVDDKIVLEKSRDRENIPPGQFIGLRNTVQGETWQAILNGQSRLKVNLVISYSDGRGRGQSRDVLVQYDPGSDDSVVLPRWSILRNR